MISSIVVFLFSAILFMFWVFAILADSAEIRPLWVVVDIVFPVIGVIRGFLLWLR